MTHYCWMHWFWITLFLDQFVFVAFGHSLLTTLHSIPPTTDLPTTNFGNVSETNTTTGNVTIIPPRTYSPLVVRNSSSYSKNVSVPKPRQFSNRLDVIPLEVPSKYNATKLDNNTNRDLAVINQTFTEPTLNVSLTGYISSTNASINSSNHTDNVTYLGEEPNYNHSLIQSERIGIEQDLDIEEPTGNLSAAGITGITLGCIVVVGMICGVSFFIYRNQGFNRPQVLNDRCSNPDSSGYIDDASVRKKDLGDISTAPRLNLNYIGDSIWEKLSCKKPPTPKETAIVCPLPPKKNEPSSRIPLVEPPKPPRTPSPLVPPSPPSPQPQARPQPQKLPSAQVPSSPQIPPILPKPQTPEAPIPPQKLDPPSKPPRSPSPHPIRAEVFDDIDYEEEESDESSEPEEEEDSVLATPQRKPIAKTVNEFIDMEKTS